MVFRISIASVVSMVSVAFEVSVTFRIPVTFKVSMVSVAFGTSVLSMTFVVSMTSELSVASLSPGTSLASMFSKALGQQRPRREDLAGQVPNSALGTVTSVALEAVIGVPGAVACDDPLLVANSCCPSTAPPPSARPVARRPQSHQPRRGSLSGTNRGLRARGGTGP